LPRFNSLAARAWPGTFDFAAGTGRPAITALRNRRDGLRIFMAARWKKAFR